MESAATLKAPPTASGDSQPRGGESPLRAEQLRGSLVGSQCLDNRISPGDPWPLHRHVARPASGFSIYRSGCREGSRGFVSEEANVPISLERQSVVRRWVSPLLMFTGIVIGLVAVSRATDPQVRQKAQVATPTAPGEAEVRDLLKAVINAYNRTDAEGLAARFTDDAELIDQDGAEVRGRDAIGRHYEGTT